MSITKIEPLTPLVVGVSILDISMALTEETPTIMDGAMYHAKAAQSAGGVGRNLADSMYKLFGKVNFISLIGNDPIGEILLKLMPDALWQRIVKEDHFRTSSCTVIFDKYGDCKSILGDMEIHKNFDPNYIVVHRDLFKIAPLIIIDGNLPMDTISFILQEAQLNKVPVFYEPTDLRIAGQPYKYIPQFLTQQIRLISPNIAELRNIIESKFVNCGPLMENLDFKNLDHVLETCKSMILSIHHLFDCIVVTLGQHGVVLCVNSTVDPYVEPLFSHQKYVLNKFEPNYTKKRIIFFPTPEIVGEADVVNVSGAGDSFSGGFISGLLKAYTVCQAVALGFMAARRALLTTAAVPEKYFYDNKAMETPYWHKQLDNLKIHGEMNEREL